MKKFLGLFILFSISYVVFAQPKYTSSTQLLADGFKEYKSEDYRGALKYYSQVNKNDEKYFNAQYEMSLCYYELKIYDTTIQICLKLLDKKYSNENQAMLYVNIGNSYEKLKKYQEAIQYIDEAILKYPMFYLLYYNKAVYHKSNHELQKAIDNLEKAIYYNPNHVSSHLLLGQIAAEEGMLVQAMLCFNTCVFLNPDDPKSLNILQYLNTTISKKYESKESGVTFSKVGDDFNEVEEIIRAQAALNSKYKLEVDVDYPFIRQNQVLFSYLQNYKPKDGFFDKYYVPFYKEIYAKKYFTNYIYLLLFSSDNVSIQAKVKKNIKDISTFYKWAIDEYMLKCGKRNIETDEKEVYFFYDNGSLNRIGAINDKMESEGNWIFNYPNGLKSGEGIFKSNVAEGNWKFYFMNQQLMETKNFNKEILQGENIFYYENGNIKEKINYINDSIDGNYESFNYFGVKTSEIQFVNNKKNGISISYYLNGQKHYEINNTNDQASGVFKSYYPNGIKEYEAEMKVDKRNGKFTSYFVNGTINEEYIYKDDLKDGPYKIYYRNGKLKEEGAYLKDKHIGQCKMYYITGGIETILDFDKEGNESGLIKDYDYDGILYSEMLKNKKKILSLKYLDKNGQTIYETKVKDNVEIKLYRPDGTIAESGKSVLYNKDGVWTGYYRCGAIASIIEYKNGLKDGQSKFFYPNGQLKGIYYYKNDTIYSTYESYFINGQINTKGFYQNDQVVGLNEVYYPNGQLSQSYFVNVNGEIEGEFEYFDDYGHVSSIQLYKAGEIYGENLLDTSGKIFSSQLFKFGDEKILKNFHSEFEQIEYDYKNGVFQGNYKSISNHKELVNGRFVNDLRDGIWTWKSILDSTITKANYELGLRQGIQKNYTIDGKLSTECMIVDDVENGPLTKFYYNGNKFIETFYIDGEEEGLKTIYGIDGEKIIQMIMKNGDITSCIINTAGKELNDTIKILDGNIHLIAKYKTGKKALEFTLRNGLLDSTYTVYTKDEKTILTASYKNGELNGERKYYYTSGRLYLKENLKDDLYNGNMEIYNENGTQKALIPYYNDNINGEVKIFDQVGKLIELKSYYNSNLMYVKKI